MAKEKATILEPEGITPVKADPVTVVVKLIESNVGNAMLDRDVIWPIMEAMGTFIELKMPLRHKLLCQVFVRTMDLAMASNAVRMNVQDADKALSQQDARNYVSVLLDEQISDTSMTPEIWRSRVMQVEQAVVMGKITHHTAAAAHKLLELYAKGAGYLVQEQAQERKTQPLGFTSR